ncbi:ferrous iron transport protein B [compost metagenome]
MEYLKKIGTTIFVFSILIWILLNFGFDGYCTNINSSFGYISGTKLESIFSIIGLGYWQVILSLISGLAGKELIVSTLYQTFNQNNADFSLIFSNIGFNFQNAISFIIFCLLYTPCIATVATIHKETKSYKFATFCVLFQLLIAFVVSFFCYEFLKLII